MEPKLFFLALVAFIDIVDRRETRQSLRDSNSRPLQEDCILGTWPTALTTGRPTELKEFLFYFIQFSLPALLWQTRLCWTPRLSLLPCVCSPHSLFRPPAGHPDDHRENHVNQSSPPLRIFNKCRIRQKLTRIPCKMYTFSASLSCTVAMLQNHKFFFFLYFLLRHQQTQQPALGALLPPTGIKT